MSSAAIRSWTFGPSMPEGGGDRFRSRFSHQAARADHLAARCAVDFLDPILDPNSLKLTGIARNAIAPKAACNLINLHSLAQRGASGIRLTRRARTRCSAKTNEQLDLQWLEQSASSAAVPPQLRHGHLGNHSCAPAERALRTWAVPASRGGPARQCVAIPASIPIRQDGKFASLDVMRPRETFSRNTMPPRVSRPIT